jgi:hypothetical protein
MQIPDVQRLGPNMIEEWVWIQPCLFIGLRTRFLRSFIQLLF